MNKNTGTEGGYVSHRANKTLPAPFATERLNRPRPVPNALLALFTLWHPQPYMAVLAIRMALIHRKPDIRILECSVSRKAPVS